MAKEKRGARFNIGTVIFGAIFIYLIITVVLNVTRKDVRTYMVSSGTLSGNETYTAIALREERLARATAGGFLNYYVPDGTMTGRNELVCAVSDRPVVVEKIEPSAQVLSDIRDRLTSFTTYYDSDAFSRVYDLGYSLDSLLLSTTQNADIRGTVYRSETDGVVCLSTDGYESLTANTLQLADFDTKDYKKTMLTSASEVSAGDALYRIVPSEVWSVVFPLTDRQRVALESRETIKVLFEKDKNTETGDLTLFEREGQTFAQVTFSSGMVRYCGDRFLEIELVTNTRSGLKIPVSSVVSKEFYTIPAAYLTYGGDNDNAGFLTERTDEEGNVRTVHISATLYAKISEEGNEENALYYVDKSVFREGDVLIAPDSSSRFPVGQTGELQGVYCVNEGYAIFRKITILDQNEEYCIVQNGVDYGISQFDYIVQNGREVVEEEIVY